MGRSGCGQAAQCVRAGVAVSENSTWHVVVASLRHLAKAVVVVLIHSSHCIHWLSSHLLQQQTCRRMDAVGERASHLGDAAAQPRVIATLSRPQLPRAPSCQSMVAHLDLHLGICIVCRVHIIRDSCAFDSCELCPHGHASFTFSSLHVS